MGKGAFNNGNARERMMFGWWRRRKEMRAAIIAEADAMIAEHGDSAYWVARDRALEERLHKIIDAERTADHWNRVRFEIRRRMPVRGADVATKYLDGGQ
jgi:hypothetical protein